MNSSNKFLIIQTLDLILISLHDVLQKQNIEKISDKLIAFPNIIKGLNILINVRKVNILNNAEELNNACLFIFNKLQVHNIKNLILLSNTPELLINKELAEANPLASNLQIYSKLEEAMVYLKIPIERKRQLEIKLLYLEEYCYLI